MEPLLESFTVWDKDEGGAEAFNAFGLCVAQNGDVLAFCEGRVRPTDGDPMHIFFKRSRDGGRSWSENRVLVDSVDGLVLHNPTPVLDRSKGSVFLFYGDCGAELETSGMSGRLLLIRSDDDGETWTEPTDLTSLFDDDPLGRPYHCPGSGHGLQMKSGRLIIPVWHRKPLSGEGIPADQRDYAISIVCSDDGGETWHNGAYTDIRDAEGNYLGFTESRCMERPDGSLLVNSRVGATSRGKPNRVVGISRDGGLTWEPGSYYAFEPSWPTDSPTISYDERTLIFARPDCPWPHEGLNEPGNSRRNITVYVSRDELRSYEHKRVVDPGNAYYSDLCLLPDKTILLLYGKDFCHNCVAVRAACARFNMAWIERPPRG